MKNIAIICDSSVAIDQAQAQALGVHLVPLTVIQGTHEYHDQVNIDHDQVNQFLRDGDALNTSQPSLGIIIEMLESLKPFNYDAIFILSLSSYLSGTYNSFHQAIEATQIPNTYLIDSYTLAGPVQQGIALIHKLNAENVPVLDILDHLNQLFLNTKSYIYPENLDRLKLSGRITKGAAMMASLLKVKPILALNTHGQSIEKFGAVRTESKAFELIINDLVENDITPATHDLYFLENMGYITVSKLKKAIFERLGAFECTEAKIPAVVSAHAGLGTVVLQWVQKIS